MPDLQPSGAFRWTQAAGGRALQCRPLLEYAPHLFTSRDLQLRGETEWASVADAMGVTPSRLRLIRQVHGVDVAVARSGGGAGWSPPEADAIISDDPDVAIGVRVADCAPVLLCDTRLGVVGAVHAGWRGTLQRAAPSALSALRAAFGSNPQDVIAAIGPCLGVCCGEVGPEVVDAFGNAGHSPRHLAAWFRPGRGDRSHLDLALANAQQLTEAGVPRGSVYDAAICTKSHSELFHSYRAEGAAAGRMAAMIRKQEG